MVLKRCRNGHKYTETVCGECNVDAGGDNTEDYGDSGLREAVCPRCQTTFTQARRRGRPTILCPGCAGTQKVNPTGGLDPTKPEPEWVSAIRKSLRAI